MNPFIEVSWDKEKWIMVLATSEAARLAPYKREV